MRLLDADNTLLNMGKNAQVSGIYIIEIDTNDVTLLQTNVLIEKSIKQKKEPIKTKLAVINEEPEEEELDKPESQSDTRGNLSSTSKNQHQFNVC